MIKSLKDCVEFIAGDKTILREILNPNKEKLELGYSLAWFKVLPGRRTVKHSLKSSEVYYILSGKGLMHLDGESFEVGAKDSIYIAPNTVQWLENLSKTDELTALCIVDPAWKKEDETIHE